MLEPAYIKALEVRTRWLRWALEGHAHRVWSRIEATTKDEGAFLSILPEYTAALETGDTFCMVKPFLKLVAHAIEGIPDNLVFDHTWLQARDGWLWLEERQEIPQARTVKEYGAVDHFAAVSWFSVPEGTKLCSGRPAKVGATQFLMYQDFLKYGSEGFGTWSYFLLEDGDILGDRITEFERKSLSRISDPSHFQGGPAGYEMKWVCAAFYLMAQKLSLVVRHETDRHTTRRSMREGNPVQSFIRVITLRRLEEDRKNEGATKLVDWQWQWEVRGHWRNQFISSTGEHRPVFIEAYIKGPENKPLKPSSHKIFVAGR